jgi:hypothetical protein
VRFRGRTVDDMKVSVTLYAAIALCFLLPFGTVSCGGDDRVSLTGVQLATWSVPGAGQTSGGPNLAQQVEDGGSFMAFLALVAVLTALGLSRTRYLGSRLLSALAALLLLLWLPVKAAAELADIELGVGFVFACVLLLFASGVESTRLVRRRRSRADARDPLGHGGEQLGHSLR